MQLIRVFDVCLDSCGEVTVQTLKSFLDFEHFITSSHIGPTV